jgi:hypothetical protein
MVITKPEQLSTIGRLVLARLLIGGDKGDTTAKIKKDVEPLLAHRWVGVALAERINQAVAELEQNSLVAILRGKTKKSAPKVVLTQNGYRCGLDFLGVAELPPRTTWAKLRKIYLPAQALGLVASSDAVIKAVASEPGFKAILLKRQYALPTAAPLPKLDEALDALAWQLIGFGGSTLRFDLKSVKIALFNRELGDGRATDFKKAAAHLLARKVAARRDNPRELRDAVLRNWIDNEEPGRTVPDPVDRPSLTPLERPASSHPVPLGQTELASFAEQVKTAARTCTSGRFGDNKVFIAHVWKAIQDVPPFQSMDLTIFKEQLAAANNARLLDLSRADLVQAMDPEDVRQSEVHYLNATFHFVRI